MNDSKRVAHVLWRSQGGIRRHVRTLAAHPPAGWQTAGIWGPPDLAGYFDGIGVPFHAISKTGLLTPPAGVDLIHAHGITAGMVALAPGRPPVVVSSHVVVGRSGRTTRSPVASMIAKRIARKADAIVAVSPEAAQAFGGGRAPKVRIIAPAFDALPPPTVRRDDVRTEIGSATDDVVVVTVSRLEETKRLDLLINAVEAAGCVGWIVGDGPRRDEIAALALGSRTKLLGYRPDVADILGAADVFALPSSSESYGIAVAEAVAMGLPVVATATGAIAELVGPAGIVVPPDDDDAFVRAVCAVTADADQRARYAQAARTVVPPDASSLIAELGAVYDELATEEH